MNFYVGMKVVCINARPQRGCRWDEGESPCEGAIYTISRICRDDDGDNILSFFELQRTLRSIRIYGENVGYWSFRFRPLIERSTETGMAILRKVADDAAARRNLVRLDQ